MKRRAGHAASPDLSTPEPKRIRKRNDVRSLLFLTLASDNNVFYPFTCRSRIHLRCMVHQRKMMRLRSDNAQTHAPLVLNFHRLHHILYLLLLDHM